MVSRISLVALILVSCQIVSSFGEVVVDDSIKRICAAPNLAGKGAERIRLTEVFSKAFLSENAQSAPVICLGNNLAQRFETDEPSTDDEVMNKAREAIGETSPEAIDAAKEKLVELLKNNPKLNVPLDNDDWIIRFLRLRKYDVPAAYELIKNYYNFKVQNKNFFQGLVPSEQSEVAERNTFTVLPNRDQKGRRTIVVMIRNYNPKEVTLVDQFRTAIVLAEAGAYEPATQIAGIQLIIDAKGLTSDVIRQVTPSFAKQAVDYATRAGPLRMEAVHIVNHSRLFSTLFNMFKPFMPKDLKSKVFFHKDMNSLHKRVSPSALPDVFGGSYPMPALSGAEWLTIMRAFDQEFKSIANYGVAKRN